MANDKQAGSNIVQIEYTTGVCSSTCECCFVNLGDRGLAQCKDVLVPRNKHAFAHAMEEGARTGLYTPPPILRGARARRGEELLRGEITESGQGLFDIPLRTPAWGIDPVKAAKKIRGTPPMFSRVSTMSDSLRAPADWLRAVREAWGDYCFFNSSVNTLRWVVKHRGQKHALGEVHKLVVTVNPGRQKLQPFRPAITRFRDKRMRIRAMFDWRDEVKRRGYPQGSMVSGREKPGSFFQPLSLSMIDLAGMEPLVKFYRLRLLPTIWPRFEADSPVLVTMLRFKGVEHILDWCRAYELNAEVRLGKRYMNAEAPRLRSLWPQVKIVQWAGYDIGKQVLVWSKKRDPLNTCPDAGEASVFEHDGSWYRPRDVEAFDPWPYVCDRARGSCKMCGLCVTLDGTQDRNTNWLNVMPWGDVWPPIPGPDGARYIGEAGLFESALQERGIVSGLEGLGSPEAYRLNPGGPLHVDDALALLKQVEDYFTGGEDWREDWNTHEQASTTRDLAVWSLAVRAQSRGMDFDEWLDGLPDGSLEGCDLAGIWDGTADCVAGFLG
jgi:hypothetical protein